MWWKLIFKLNQSGPFLLYPIQTYLICHLFVSPNVVCHLCPSNVLIRSSWRVFMAVCLTFWNIGVFDLWETADGVNYYYCNCYRYCYCYYYYYHYHNIIIMIIIIIINILLSLLLLLLLLLLLSYETVQTLVRLILDTMDRCFSLIDIAQFNTKLCPILGDLWHGWMLIVTLKLWDLC